MNFIPFGVPGVPYPYPIMPSMGWGWPAALGELNKSFFAL